MPPPFRVKPQGRFNHVVVAACDAEPIPSSLGDKRSDVAAAPALSLSKGSQTQNQAPSSKRTRVQNPIRL